MDINKVLLKMQDTLPPQPAVRFTVENTAGGLFDCKIGGTPYFPKAMDFPRGKNGEFAGEPLTLLAQINFEQTGKIDGFPDKGILQFFIAPDDLYGMAAECSGEALARQDNFRVIYHRDIITDVSQLLTAEEIPQSEKNEDGYMPFDGEYRLIPQAPEMMPATVHDIRFEDVFVGAYNALAAETGEEPITNLWDLGDEVAEGLFSEEGAPTAVIGGYPLLTQEDPRYDEKIADCDVLLFGLYSYWNKEKGIDICWGDVGTGNFFIPRENLRALDFSKVIYNYDCC